MIVLVIDRRYASISYGRTTGSRKLLEMLKSLKIILLVKISGVQNCD